MPPPKGGLPPPPSSIKGQLHRANAADASAEARIPPQLETARSVIPPPNFEFGGREEAQSTQPERDADAGSESSFAATTTANGDSGGYLDISPAAATGTASLSLDTGEAAAEEEEEEVALPTMISKQAEFTVGVEAAEGADGFHITLGNKIPPLVGVVIVSLENVKASYSPEIGDEVLAIGGITVDASLDKAVQLLGRTDTVPLPIKLARTFTVPRATPPPPPPNTSSLPNATSAEETNDVASSSATEQLVEPSRNHLVVKFQSLLSMVDEKGGNGGVPASDGSTNHQPSAMLSLAHCYAEGRGVLRDPQEAAKWFLQAAEKGETEAQYFLGRAYLQGSGVVEDISLAAKWFAEAAEKGEYPPAMQRLGDMYYQGNGVQQDYTKAFGLYSKAAHQNPELWTAQYALGRCYQAGQGCAQNFANALKAFQLAADKGDMASAQYELGNMFRNGQGTAQSPGMAALWFTRSAELGNGDGALALSECYLRGQGMPNDERLAMVWLQEAARQGTPAASYRMYLKHLHGEDGVEPNKEEAELWLSAAAQQGSTEAHEVLARQQADADGMPKVVELSDDEHSPLKWAPPAAGTDWKSEVAEAYRSMPSTVQKVASSSASGDNDAARATAPSPNTVSNNAAGAPAVAGGAGTCDPSTSSQRAALLPGTTVEIINLKQNVKLNGCRGVVRPRAPNAKPGRVGVLLEGEKKAKAIKFENLKILYVVAGGAMPLE